MDINKISVMQKQNKTHAIFREYFFSLNIFHLPCLIIYVSFLQKIDFIYLFISEYSIFYKLMLIIKSSSSCLRGRADARSF